MTGEPRKRRQQDREPCGEFHNPGYYPWLAACVLAETHKGNHRDLHGNEWEREPAPRKIPRQRTVKK